MWMCSCMDVRLCVNSYVYALYMAMITSSRAAAGDADLMREGCRAASDADPAPPAPTTGGGQGPARARGTPRPGSVRAMTSDPQGPSSSSPDLQRLEKINTEVFRFFRPPGAFNGPQDRQKRFRMKSRSWGRSPDLWGPTLRRKHDVG